jgi:Mrp family chromosome partitioning ATPase
MLLHNTERNGHPTKSSSAAQPPAWTSIESERKAVSALVSFLRRNRRLIGEPRSNHNRILMDSSPLLPVADPQFLVNIDGVILIVASEQTSRSAVKAALQETPGIEAKILGTVMNRAQDDFARSYPEYGFVHKVA